MNFSWVTQILGKSTVFQDMSWIIGKTATGKHFKFYTTDLDICEDNEEYRITIEKVERKPNKKEVYD